LTKFVKSLLRSHGNEAVTAYAVSFCNLHDGRSVLESDAALEIAAMIRSFFLASMFFTLAWSASSYAVVQSWHMEPAQSSLKITAKVTNILTITASPQVTGGDIDNFGGTLAIGRTTQGGNTSLAFSGGSLLDATLNPVAPFSPPVGPGTGTEDNYGMKASFLTSTYLVAVRDLALDITSGSAVVGQTAPVNFQIMAGIVSFNQNGGATTSAALDTAATHPNTSSSPLTIANTGGVERLTLPVTAKDTETISPFTINITFSGQIVATRGKVGDYDGDGIFGAGDYSIWKSTFGSKTNLAADGDGNGIVDAADYTVWRDQLGPVAGAAAIVTVPEPNSCLLLGLGGLAIGVARKLQVFGC
jgi:hypothetical protein